MIEQTASQGMTPVNLPVTIALSDAADLRNSVSADSFRKLTALLKKPAVAAPIQIPTIVPIIVAPVPEIIVQKPIDAPVIVPVIVEATTEPETTEQIQLDAQPEPEVYKLPYETPQRDESQTTQPSAKQSSSKLKPRDAFAVTPSQVPPRAPAPPIQQTPAQEQEAAELARSLLDMMASGNSAGLPQERALAADTLLRMMPRLPLRSLIMLAERVRMMDAPPHLLMAKLIADPNIAVAGPLLEDCMHITDEDLIMVIGEADLAKIRIMARRRRLTRAITTELIKTADASVLLTLVRNLGAEIAQESYSALHDFANDHQEILAPLCTRPDLPVPMAFELFWLAPVQLRRYLLSRFLTDSETLTKILKITRVADVEEPTQMESTSPEKVQSALALAGQGDLDEAAAILGECAEINVATALRVLSDSQGEPLAALLKVVGMPRGNVVETFAKLQQSAAGLIDPAREVDELQSTFDSLSFNKARILLTYWDWATLKAGPYAPLN